MPIYKVGIMSNTELIEGPSAESAALFYGLNTNGNAQLMAAVYEQDGQPYAGERLPWAKYMLDDYYKDGDGLKELTDLFDKVKPDVYQCKFVEVEEN